MRRGRGAMFALLAKFQNNGIDTFQTWVLLSYILSYLLVSASYIYIYFSSNCMFYQLLRVQHSCSSTQSWGSVLPSIVETRDQNPRGCPLFFSNRNLGPFCA